jgi:hypothetical protein
MHNAGFGMRDFGTVINQLVLGDEELAGLQESLMVFAAVRTNFVATPFAIDSIYIMWLSLGVLVSVFEGRVTLGAQIFESFYFLFFLNRLVLRERFLGRLLITTRGSLLVYF